MPATIGSVSNEEVKIVDRGDLITGESEIAGVPIGMADDKVIASWVSVEYLARVCGEAVNPIPSCGCFPPEVEQ